MIMIIMMMIMMMMMMMMIIAQRRLAAHGPQTNGGERARWQKSAHNTTSIDDSPNVHNKNIYTGMNRVRMIAPFAMLLSLLRRLLF